MNGRAGERGITLMELMIVMAIIALVSALAFPGVTTGMDTLKMRTSADAVAAVLTQAMLRVERTQEAVEVRVMPGAGRIEARSARPGFVRGFQLPDGLRMTGVTPGVVEEGAWSLVLQPGGTFPRLSIGLMSVKGQARVVRIDPLTATAVVEPGRLVAAGEEQ